MSDKLSLKKIGLGIAILALIFGLFIINQLYRPAEASFAVENGIDHLSVSELIKGLETRSLDFKPQNASVRTHEILFVDANGKEGSIEIGEMFYVSIAPYVNQTHECFYHNLVTCQGELVEENIHVRVTDQDGTVLIDENGKTYANGFYGLWLPRDINATLSVTYGDLSLEQPITTHQDSATCLTDLQLS